MENKKRLDKLIIRLLEKRSTPAEEAELDKWVQLRTENREYFEQIQALWVLTKSENLPGNQVIDFEWERFSGKHLALNPGISWRNIASIAAAFIAGIIMAWLVTNYYLDGSYADFKEAIIKVPYGAKSVVTLPDGSLVTLNSGSVLSYNSGYGCANRDVHLTGEAFFDVAYNDEAIFQVITSGIIVKAYGTKFNVKSYEDESTIETTLVEGSIGITPIKISDEQFEEIVLKPKERVVYYLSEDRIIQTDTEDYGNVVDGIAGSYIPEKLSVLKKDDIEQYIAWTQDRIVLNSEKLHELAIKIERKYNVSIRFEDAEIGEYRFTGVIENETIESVIKAIAISSSVDYSIKERIVTFRRTN